MFYQGSDLVTGKLYTASITASNICGTSDPSNVVTLAPGTEPTCPTIVQTTTTNAVVDGIPTKGVCTWSGSLSNGFDITGYAVSIRARNDNNVANSLQFQNIVPYCEETQNVNNRVGTQSMMQGNQCTFNLEVVRALPWGLAEESQIECQVVPYNQMGPAQILNDDFNFSRSCRGAGGFMPILARPPQAPTLQFRSRACGQMTVQCFPNANNGGAAVIGYTFSYSRVGTNSAPQTA